MDDRQREAIRELLKMVSGMGKISYFYLPESLENTDYMPDPVCPEAVRTRILSFISGEYMLQVGCGECVHYIIAFGIHFQVLHLPDGDGYLMKGPFRYKEPMDLEIDDYLVKYGLKRSSVNRQTLKDYLTGITNAHANTLPLEYACRYILGKTEQDIKGERKIFLEEQPKNQPEKQQSRGVLNLQNLRYLDEKYAREQELRAFISQGKRNKAGTLLQNWDSTVYLGHKEMNTVLRLLELNIICKQAMQDAKIPSVYIEKTYASVIRDLVSDSRRIGKNENKYSAHMLDVYCGLVRDYMTQNYSRQIKRAMDYILLNYREKIRLEEVAEYAGLSPNYLSHLFKKETGEALVSYIGRIRVGGSLTLLANTELSVSEIAEKVGFESGNYFSRIFKKQMNISPMEYRRNYQAVSEEMYRETQKKS